MNRILLAAALAALAACTPPAPPPSAGSAPITPAATTAPAGVYTLDPAHTSVLFRIDHLGLSHYTARFTGVAGQLRFDPAHPENSSVTATIDARSLQTDYPFPKKLDFDKQISGPEFLDAPKFPQIIFKSTKVELTAPNAARVTGDFTLHGVTKPLVLQVTFNGGYPAGGMDPQGARIGFSARGMLKRSDFGIAFGIPAPGSKMGVGDETEIAIETEFTQPAPAKP